MDKNEYEMNSIFKKLKIPLKVNVYHISIFKTKDELITFISNAIKRDHDLIVLLNSDVLNDTQNNNGHACVIDRIYPTKNIVRVIDPSAGQAKWREITLDKLIKAMSFHPAGNGRILKLFPR